VFINIPIVLFKVFYLRCSIKGVLFLYFLGCLCYLCCSYITDNNELCNGLLVQTWMSGTCWQFILFSVCDFTCCIKVLVDGVPRLYLLNAHVTYGYLFFNCGVLLVLVD
jgi:hypothetical protein